MKTRPVLFNSEMVRAILSGQKTMTRRVMKVQPESNEFGIRRIVESSKKSEEGKFFWSIFGATGLKQKSKLFACPFGEVGDRLWVRESAKVISFPDSGEFGKIKIEYAADGEIRIVDFPCERLKPVQVNQYLSNGCYREASRITLEITNVRVQRLLDISKEDARAEGFGGDIPQYGFISTWRDIYGEADIDENPWLWVIEFKRVDQ